MKKIISIVIIFSLFSISKTAFSLQVFEYNTGDFGELIDPSIPNCTYDIYKNGNPNCFLNVDITKGCCGSSDYWVAVYQIDLGPNVQAGDILMVAGEVEVTNQHNYIVSVLTTLMLSRFSSTSPTSSLSGLQISEDNGPNLDNYMIHHDVHTNVGTITVPNSNYRYVTLWVRATSLDYSWPDRIYVEADGGRLSVLRFSNIP